MKSELKQKYLTEVIPAMQAQFGYKNKISAPKISAISINVGLNARNTDSGLLETVEKTLMRVTGQKPIRTKAKKAISAFKVRENMVVGVKVSLRGRRMYDFVEKLIKITIPRIRDFRGLKVSSVDDQGNLTIGFKEHNVFPEIMADEVERVHGLEVTIATTAKNQEQGLALFKLLGFPFQK